MSDRRSASDLGESAEATLAAFPFPERDWERDARAIEARLTSAVRGSTDASLLAAPLPSEAGEPSTTSATATPLTNSGVRTQSLAELARRSVEKKQAADRQMARESLALAGLAAQQRPKSASSDDTRALPANRGGFAPASVVTSPVAASSATPANAPSAPAKPFPKLALAFPALALAAAALLWFRQPQPIALVEGGPAPAAPNTATATANTNAAAAAPLAQHEEVPRGIDPNTLPADPGAPTADSAGNKAGVVAAAPTKPSASKPGSAPARAAQPASGDPGLPPDPALRPADSRSGDLPAKPSTGAVQAALGTVMSGARHCVAGDDGPSRAVVVFGSDGRVQQVTVSGAAAGKSSASCIEAQLSRARVQPFAASSFSVNATVRPE